MRKVSSHIRKILEQLPDKPGVYRFLDKAGTILYIGKAINLKSRVRSYFSNDLVDRPWVRQMIPLIFDIRVIEAENEVESLILESNLIKKHNPKYNSAGKDDKKYAWIEVEQRVTFPRVRKTRNLDGKGRYFGPYPDGAAVNHVLSYLRTIYPFRNCNLEMPAGRSAQALKKSRRCMFYHLKLCPAPCDDLITPSDYRKNIRNIAKTLDGKKRSHIRELKKNMLALAEEERYEEAARMRDKMNELSYLSQRIDVHYGDTEEEIREIQQNRFTAGISEIVALLEIPIPPEKYKTFRIECYDISNLSSEISYGSMVVSEGSTILPSQYRVFKFTEESEQNDPEMIKKVLTRRMRHISSVLSDKNHQDESLSKRPSLILLDGAATQLAAARSVLPDSIRVFAISKGKHMKRRGMLPKDEFWTIASSGKVRRLRIENPFLFQHLRDEAHRFAIKHLRQGKRFLQKKSVLDDISSIGPKRRKNLIKAFGSIEKIMTASEQSLELVLKNKAAAHEVYTFFLKKR